MRNPALAIALLLCCAARPPPAPVTLSIVGTTDLHGHVERTAVLSGFLKNLREARKQDGAVVLVDAGDLFQGTLESNPNEGAAVIRAYNLLGYNAAAIGNHEFDFGPDGPDATVRSAAQDPRGALKSRAAQARFPFLAANIVNDNGTPLAWPNVKPATIVEARGIKVGIIGVATMGTPRTTIASNFKGLKMIPADVAIIQHARILRGQGAQIILVAAHAGGGCHKQDDPKDLSSCRKDEEVMQLAQAIPPGTVDVIVAGHTHQGMAHEVNGIPIIEAYANGRAFGRVDITLDGPKKTVRLVGLQDLCDAKVETLKDCRPGSYEGAPVVLDQSVLNVLGEDLEKARVLRERPLGVQITAPVKRSYAEESALGNLVADLMREARPGVDAAITNGGGLRADLPAGPLTYGAVYEALPFDNRFATVTLSAARLQDLFENNLSRGGGILVISGVNVAVRCQEGTLSVSLTREGGAPIADNQQLRVITTDFLATGGDGVFGELGLPPEQIVLDEGPPMREAVVEVLKKRRGSLSGQDPLLISETARRVDFPGKRPLRCSK